MSVRGGRPVAHERTAYFSAAYALVSERGADAVTVPQLCTRLDVTKGAFYHQFEGLPAFVDEFAAFWRTWFVSRIDEFAGECDQPRRWEVVANGCLFAMTPGMRAMRAWARTNPVIAEAMLAPHRSVAAMAHRMVADLTPDEHSPRVLSVMTLSMYIGITLRPQPLSNEHLLRLVARSYRGTAVESDLIRVNGRTRLKVISMDGPEPVSTTSQATWNNGPKAAGADTGTLRHRLDPRAGTRDRYFAAATQLLGARGSEGVSVAAMADRLELTKGSFYHCFSSLPAFVEELAGEWESAELAHIDDCLRHVDPLRRLEALVGDLLIGPNPAETAWRAWGHTNPLVRQALRCVDGNRERAIAMTLRELPGTSDPGLVAEMTVGLMLGLHRWHPPLDEELITQVAIEWMRRVIGIDSEVRTDSGMPRLALRRT